MNQDAQKYIKAIRNPAKRAYAEKLAAYFENGDFSLEARHLEPSRGELSFMAAQAVRMNLSSILLDNTAKRSL